jgi:hypothetical protein
VAKNTYLKFDTAVRDYYGSNNTAIAFARLLYWCRRNPNGFYKFKQPCKHPLYNKGDSWSEELNMTKEVMAPIFSRLVTYYKSKNEYRNSTDKFNGKLFCSYTERNTNKTYYFMDNEAVEAFLESLNAKVPPLPSSALPSQTSKITPPRPPRAAAITPPLHAGASNSLNTQTITSLPTEPSQVVGTPTEEEKLSSQKMVGLWNSHTQDTVVWYPSTASKLYKVLADFFGGCLEAFKKYCKAIANTNFLMGKAPNSKFKAFFYWAIKPEVIKSIFQGAYGVKDILSRIVNDSEAVNLEREYETITYKIQNVKDRIEYSKRQVIDAQEKSIREYQQTISQEVKDHLLKQVESEVKKAYDLSTYSQQERGWLINPKHQAALINYSRDKLNLCNPEDIIIPQELIDEQRQLEDRRVAICKRLQEIVKQMREEQQKIESLVDKAA